MREINLDIIKKHWDDPKTKSLKDRNLQTLERQYILEALAGIGSVDSIADIGCGDGEDTAYWSAHAKEVFGYDYSQVMTKKALNNIKGKAIITNFDLLQHEFDRCFDVAITKRCLINLGNFSNQKRAIKKIHANILKNGYFIMLECCKQGSDSLNHIRKNVGLQSIPEPFHNTYFDFKELKKYIEKYFSIESVRYFSTYYFLTRVYNHLLDGDNYSSFDAIAQKVHLATNIFNLNIIGPQFLMVLKKREM